MQGYDYDWIVIGSGFGGSVSALRLAEKGYRVAVLESGRRYADWDFAKTTWDLKRFLWAPLIGCRGILRMTPFRDVFITSGAGVGGGSIVYANTLYRAKPEYFANAQWAGLENWQTELAPHYEAADVVVYKSPTCGCCKNWISHLQENGFTVEVHNRHDMSPIKSELGVPRHLQSCHTAKVGDYVVEGHVPAEEIARLLDEKPAVMGLAVPGMPMGSPGMEGPRKDAYDILTFQKNGRTSVYARRNQ